MPTIRRINQEAVKAIPQLGKVDTRPIKGSKLFEELYANCFLCARKKSGKTSVIFKILQECATTSTTIVAFVSTLHKDSGWKSIQTYCENKKIPFVGHTSLIDEDGVNQLEELVQHLQKEAEEPEPEPEIEKKPIVLYDDSDGEEIKPKKVKKSKFRSPEYIFIFDDLSNELKNPALLSLLKKNRHFKSKILISSQYLNDLLPQSRKQCDIFLIFRGQPQNKLDEIYKDADLAISKEEFYDLYHIATQDLYSFLYIDRLNDSFRKNFNFEIKV